MKKLFIVLALIFCSHILRAQNPRPIDTIMGREPTYYYQFWFDSTDYYNDNNNACRKDINSSHYTELAKYNYTDSALRIVGVAAVVSVENNNGDPLPPPDQPDPPTVTIVDDWVEYMKLYKPTGSGMVLLASQTYSILDTVHWMKLMSNPSGYVCTEYKPVFEVYFDEPVTVTDSFYVATTNHYGGVASGDPRPRFPTFTYGQDPLSIASYCWPQLYKTGTVRDSTLHWQHQEYSFIWFIFPIIDTSLQCIPPVGLHVQQLTSANVQLAWEADDNGRSWVVAYGLATDDPEGYTSYTTSSPEYTLRDLTPGNEYAARVRAVCFDNSTYSDWSDTIQFRLEGSPTNIPYIDEPTSGILLQPNPARNEVTIHSEAPLRLVAIFDIQGHKVLEQKAHSHKATIDIHSLTKGSYIVRTTTDRGISTSKLTVE